MTSRSEIEHALDRYLADGAEQVPDRVIDAALDQIDQLPQRHALRVPWRFHDMTTFLKPALAGAAVVAVLVVGNMFLSPGQGNGIGAGPTAAPSPSPSPAPSPSPSRSPALTVSPLLDTSTWTPYMSTQYEFTIGYPSDWTVEPATRAWNLETDAGDFTSTAADSFLTSGAADGLGVRVSAWSVPFEYADAETYEEVEAWVQSYCEAAGNLPCASMLDVAVPLCIEVRDCHPGLLIAGNGLDTQAFFSGGIYGGQMVVVSIWRPDNDPAVSQYGGARKLLEAYLSTMCVWPSDSRPEAPGECLATP